MPLHITKHDKPLCRCGAYQHLHPTRWCTTTRPLRWWHEHNLRRHIAAPIWWALPSKMRWWIGWHLASDQRDWCEIVSCIIAADDVDYHSDYDDWCDVPLPTDAGPIRPGWCYCSPTGTSS